MNRMRTTRRRANALLATFAIIAALAITNHSGHASEALTLPPRMPVGGGATAAGWRGEYFANPSLTGKPAFIRREPRIHFDWKEGIAGRGLPVGGATTPGLKDFPLDDFSIRWTGQVVPRFNESYTFRVTGKDGVRFRFAGKTLVDSLTTGVIREVRSDPLRAGEKYDVVLEYVDRAGTGASVARLEWSSPSTPWEVVEPLSFAQIDGHNASPNSGVSHSRSDIKREATTWRGLPDDCVHLVKSPSLTDSEMDGNGWPTVANFQITVTPQYVGRHLFRFSGRANVQAGLWWFAGGTVVWRTRADGAGESFDMENSKGPHGKSLLPKGIGYSETENVTTAWFDLKQLDRNIVLIFTDAERAPGKPGIADLQVYGPVSDGAMEHHQPGEILRRQSREVFSNFIINRLHIGMSLNKGWTWKERTLPSYHARQHTLGWGYCLEEYIMLVNESGMDWHICIGAGWDEDYMRKFAQLVRYGSDGVNPYEHYVENPKYPPLNPNLRIYLEHSNELPWAIYPPFVWDDLRRKEQENHPDWQIVNYDNSINGVNAAAMYRYHALRIKQLSDAFRGVYADKPEAMGDRVRVLLFGQYSGPSMNTMLQFLDNYFNKADPQSTYKGEPRPPRDYVWGGGGAIYYGCSNKFGLMEEKLIANGGFEDMPGGAGTAALRPKNVGWTFTGNAGVCDVRRPSQPAFTMAKPPTELAALLEQDQWIGVKFTVGEKDLYVYQFGRWIGEQTERNFGRSRLLNMAIFDSKNTRVASTEGAPRLSAFPPANFGYAYCVESVPYTPPRALPVHLLAGQTYYLVSRESAHEQNNRFYGPTPITAVAGLTINAAVLGDGKTWQETPGTLALGPVNMIFTSEPLRTDEGIIGVPPDASTADFGSPWSAVRTKPGFPFANQCAFLQGDSSMTREFTVAKAGAYWITFNTAVGRQNVRQGQNTIRVKVNGEDVTPGLLPNGGFHARMEPWHYAATAVFRLEPGKHTVTFERVPGNGPAKESTMFIDEVYLSSEEAFYGGPHAPNFPAGGHAIGQNPASGYHRTAQGERDMALNWGLVPCTYEGGWAVQGDFDHYSMLAWNDLRFGSPATTAELTKQALRNAFDIWCQYGGYTYAYFYPVQRTITQLDAPLLEAIRELNDRLPAFPNKGAALPGTLTPDISHTQGALSHYFPTWSPPKDPKLLPAYSWKSWIVISPKTSSYRLKLDAEGGPAGLRVNDFPLSSDGTFHVTAGIHAIKVISLDQPVTINQIVIEDISQ